MLTLARRIELAEQAVRHASREYHVRLLKLQRDVERALARLEQGYLPDVAGVVQGQGAQVDVWGALLTDRIDNLRKLQAEQREEKK